MSAAKSGLTVVRDLASNVGLLPRRKTGRCLSVRAERLECRTRCTDAADLNPIRRALCGFSED
jgi:hypothetical protein